ncbi:MAG: glycosyltransferase family 4 protein [Candidatus Peribacteraceae bacterium]|nr:glycosyltransferase family 4 protein [Candidatus Peribacteraceae bacterium]
MKQRLVIFSAFLTPFRSGAEACAEEVALRLCDRFDITIITARLRRDLPKRDLLQGKVPIIRVGFGFGFDKWLYPLLAPLATWKLKPDVIHAVLESFAGLALLLNKAIGYRAVRILTLQTTNRNFLRGMIIRSPDIVTAISKVLADQAYTLGRKDVTVIPNGIPYGEIRKACDGVEKIPGRILFVGRLEKMKGVDVLLRAFAKIPVPVPKLHIVGNGSERVALENLARELSISDHVKFLGYVSGTDLYKEYAEAQIFCGLSRSEALGNVFIEAQAAGCAVIGTEIGGIPEAVHDGVTGILTEPDNPELTSYVLIELQQNEKLRTSLATAAVERAREFDWCVIAERYAKLYDV